MNRTRNESYRNPPSQVAAALLSAVLLFALQPAVPALSAAAATAAVPALTAKWIWLKGADVHAYNQTVVARKEFHLTQPQQAALRITADSFYRLFINGQWVNDGPGI